MSGGGDRTEAATPKRRRDARRKGQVARSPELPMAAGFVAAVLALPGTIGRLNQTLTTGWVDAVGRAASSSPKDAVHLLGSQMAGATRALLPMVAIILLTSGGAQLLLVGGRPNPHHLKPKFELINPKTGIKRIFSKQALYELVRNVVKLGLLTLVAVGTWQAGIARLASGSSFDGTLRTLADVLGSLIRQAAVLAFLIGLVDAVIARRRHTKQLKMTKQEVKDEHKQSEGNPESKGAIRRRQMKLSRSRMIAAVAQADVVLANPTHLVVALAYEPGAAAPVVVAKGAGSVADRIKEEARRHDVPIVEDKPLARALYRAADIGDSIPVALYRAVAEVLAVVYRARPARRAPRPAPAPRRPAALRSAA